MTKADISGSYGLSCIEQLPQSGQGKLALSSAEVIVSPAHSVKDVLLLRELNLNISDFFIS